MSEPTPNQEQKSETLMEELIRELSRVPPELRRIWSGLSDRGMFAVLLALWVALFHIYGNSTLGYVNTPSLFGWMKYVLTTSDGDSLGLYMPAIVLVLAYMKRDEIMAAPRQRWWPAVTLVILGLVLHGLGYLVQQTRVSIVGFFIGLYGLIGAVWGRRFLQASFFPFCLFIFCVPLASETERITLPLRLMATHITAFLCRTILGINVIQQGTMIFDAKGHYQYEIAAACSGIKSLSATVAIAIIGGFVSFKSPWRRLVMFVAAFPFAVLGNVLRLSAIIVASEAFGQKAGEFVHDDSILSLLPYVPAIGGVALLMRWLSEGNPKGVAAGTAGVTQVVGTPPLAPSIAAPAFGPGSPWMLVSCMAVMLMGGAFVRHLGANQRLGTPGLKLSSEILKDPNGENVGTNSVLMPVVTGYTPETDPLPRVMLDLLPPDTVYGQRRYRASDSFWIQSSVVLMGSDRSSIHKPQICLLGQGWKIEKQTPMTLRIEKPFPYDLSIMQIQASKTIRTEDGRERTFSSLFVYWFVSGDQLTADHLDRQWWMARDLLTKGLLQRWAYVTYFAACPPGLEQVTFDRMKNFIVEAVPQFQLVQGRPVGVSTPKSSEGRN